MVADCRLGRLTTPLFARSPAKAIEVFTEITLIRVDGEGTVEADSPADRLVVPLDDSPFGVDEAVVASVTLCISVVETDGPVDGLGEALDDRPSWVDKAVVAGVTLTASVVEADGPADRLGVALDDGPF